MSSLEMVRGGGGNHIYNLHLSLGLQRKYPTGTSLFHVQSRARVTKGNAFLFFNAVTTCSRKSIRYSFAVIVKLFQPDSRQGLFKKNQNERCGENTTYSHTSRIYWFGLVRKMVWRLPDTTVLRIDTTMQGKECFIRPHGVQQPLCVTIHCASTHVANFSFLFVSDGNNWWSVYNLYEYTSKISCRMRQFDDSGIPVILPALRALLLFVDVSATISFMTLLTTWTWSALKDGLSLHGGISILFVSSKYCTKLSISFNEIGFSLH